MWAKTWYPCSFDLERGLSAYNHAKCVLSADFHGDLQRLAVTAELSTLPTELSRVSGKDHATASSVVQRTNEFVRFAAFPVA